MVKIRQMAPLYEMNLLNLEWIEIFSIHYSLDVCIKSCINIFGSFLDIRQNVERPRFLAHPVCIINDDDDDDNITVLALRGEDLCE